MPGGQDSTLSLVRQGVAIDDDVIEYRHDMYGASAHHLLSCLAGAARYNSRHCTDRT